MTSDSLHARDKTLLRTAMKLARRAAQADPGWATRNLAIQEHFLAHFEKGQFSVLFAYASLAEEVGTRRIIDGFVRNGKTVLLPVIIGNQPMIAARFQGWHELLDGVLGIQRPADPTPWLGNVDVVAVPGLAFTKAGARLGYGAGYYDRWLAENTSALRVGLCFEFQLCGDLPEAPHDIPMDAIVTESGVQFTGRRVLPPAV